MSKTVEQGRVFVVQRPAYFSAERKGWVNKYDITPAREFGELVFLLRPGNLYKDQLVSTMASLRETLHDFGPNDHLLAIGDPVAIAAAVLEAGRANNGQVQMLKFDRFANGYNSYLVGEIPQTMVPPTGVLR